MQKRFCRKDFVENSKFIGESTEAAVRGCSSINSHENTRGESSYSKVTGIKSVSLI